MQSHFIANLLLAATVSCTCQNKDFTVQNIYNQSLIDLSDKGVLKDSHLPRHNIPNAYHLKLKPFLEEDCFKGKVVITITCIHSTDTIILHAHKDLEVDHKKVSVKRIDGTLTTTIKQQTNQSDSSERPGQTRRRMKISSVSRNYTTHQLRISLLKKLMKGTRYQLQLTFSGTILNESTHAIHRRSYEDSDTKNLSWFIATRMEHKNARKIFPCFDDPKYKVPFEISVARPGNMKVISNMPLRITERIKEPKGWEWDHFHVTPSMASSSIAILIFEAESLVQTLPVKSAGGLILNGFGQTHIAKQLHDEMKKVASIIHFLEEYSNITFSLPQLNIVALPCITSNEAESYWGIIMFEESELTANGLQQQLYHALPSQWIGHLVTPRGRTAEYISKGMAGYLALASTTAVARYSKYPGIMNLKPENCYELYNDFSKINVTQNSKKLRILKYEWVINMLSYALTADTFKTTLRSFLSERAFKHFKSDDLWDLMNKQAWLDHTLEANVSVQDIVSSWTARDRYPVITVTRNYENNTAYVEQEVFVRRWPYSIPGKEQMQWWIPVMYLTQENLDHYNVSDVIWMKEEKCITLDNLPGPEVFIIVNPDDIGMFIVNYDSSNWKMLSEYLSASGLEDGQPLIPAGTRAKLVHNVWYLALGGRIDFTTALNMTLFLNSEKDADVWNAVGHVYFTISWKLIGTDAETKFDRFIGQLLIPLYKSYTNGRFLGFQPQEELLSLTSYILCKAGYKASVEQARIKYEQWLQESKEIDGRILLCVFRWIDEAWESGLLRVFDLLGNDTAHAFRGYLLSQLVASTIQPMKVERVLSILLLQENYTFSDSELRSVFSAIKDCKTFLNFIINNWKSVKRRFENKPDLWQHLLEQATKKFKTQAGYNMVSIFYKTHKDELGNATSVMEHSLHVIKAYKEGIFKNLSMLEEWLDNYLAIRNNDEFYSA